MKGALLIRASREIQEMQSQINDLLRDAKDFGIDIPNEYIFAEHITGMDKYDKDERESLRRLKQTIEQKGDISVCFMWELTRLSRNPFFLIDQLRWFLEHKIPIYFHDMERWTMDRDTLAENSDTINRIFGYATYGQQEWEKIRKRTMRGRDDKARQGLYVGHLSDGYKVRREGQDKYIDIDEERSKVIQEVFDMYTEQNLSTDKIASILNLRGVLTFSALEAEVNKKNKKVSQNIRRKNTKVSIPKSEIKWCGAMISQMLKNEWYIGKRQYKGETYSIPAIIDEEQFKKAQTLSKSRAKTMPRRRDTTYPLKGLLVCGKCGALMYGHKVRIYSSYYCSSSETGRKCGAEGISKENIDGIVWDTLSREIELQSYEEDGQQRLIELFGLSNMTKEQMEADIATINTQIDFNNDQISNLSNALIDVLDKMGNAKNGILYEKLNELYKKHEKDINVLDKDVKKLERRRNEIQKTLDKGEDINITIAERVGSIKEASDIETIAKTVPNLIQRVVLYGVEASWKLIQIIFVSGQTRYILYNSHRINRQFVPLKYNNIKYNADEHRIEHDSDILVYLKQLGDHIVRFNTPQAINVSSQEEIANIIDLSKQQNLPYLLPSSTAEESYTFFKQFTKRIERVEKEPTDEEYKSWKEDYARWGAQRTERRRKERISTKKRKEEDMAKLTEGFLNVKECVERLGVPKNTFWSAVYAGRININKFGKLVYVKDEELQRFIESKNAPKDYLTPKDVMDALHLSEWRVHEDLRHGILKSTKDKQFYHISKEDFQAYKKKLGK